MSNTPRNNNTMIIVVTIIVASLIIAGAIFASGSQKGKTVTDSSVTATGEMEGGEGSIQDQIDKAVAEKMAQLQKNDKASQEEANKAREKAAEEGAKNVPRPSAEDHMRGEKDAPVTLIEYSDFSCPFCGRHHTTAKQLVEESEGKVNWVYRHFPLGFHDPAATNQATASECVAEVGGEEKFWEFADLLYENQSVGEREDLADLAEEIGVDASKVLTCLESEKYVKVVQDQLTEGQNSGVMGTPGNILINNETGETKALSGARPLPHFQTAVKELLNE